MTKSSNSAVFHLCLVWCLGWLLCGGLTPLAWGQGNVAPGHTPASRVLVLREDQVWAFAEQLFAQGEYYRAVSEYQRLKYFFPGSAHDQAATRRMVQAYILGGQATQALSLLADPQVKAHLPARQVEWLSAQAWLEVRVDEPFPRRLEGLAQACASLEAFSGHPASNPQDPLLPLAQGFLASTTQVPGDDKWPWLAGTLSAVVPGAGNWYAGHPGEGALAFFFTTLLGAAASRSIERGQGTQAAAFGSLALVFYGGGIYAAVNAVHRHNDGLRAHWLDAQRMRFGLVPKGIGFAVDF